MPQPHPIRKACKWGGLVVTTLLMAVCIGSVWWTYGGIINSQCGARIDRGRLNLVWVTQPHTFASTPGEWTRLWKHEPALSWMIHINPARGGGVSGTDLSIPLWMFILVMGGPTWWLWRKDRLRPPGTCNVCGYDLRGASHDACPECGVAAP